MSCDVFVSVISQGLHVLLSWSVMNHGRKYIDWEIKATLDKQHGLIGVQLPTLLSNSSGRVNVPARLSDNIDSGYALWVSWANFTANISSCRGYIEQANCRSNTLIRNTRERRLRNA
jgi:hypothetical protein